MFRRRQAHIIRGEDHPGHSEILTTDNQYQAHLPSPPQIVRPFIPKVDAFIGPRAARGFPTTGGEVAIGAVPAVHVAVPIPRSRWGGIDDRASTPAVFAGNPES